MDTILHWLMANRTFLEAYLLWPLISLVVILIFRKKSAQEWEAWALKSPLTALFVELAKANGWDIMKSRVAIQRYAARRAGRVPDDVWERLDLPEAVKKALQSPDTLAKLQRALEAGVGPTSPASPAPLPPSTPLPPAA